MSGTRVQGLWFEDLCLVSAQVRADNKGSSFMFSFQLPFSRLRDQHLVFVMQSQCYQVCALRCVASQCGLDVRCLSEVIYEAIRICGLGDLGFWLEGRVYRLCPEFRIQGIWIHCRVKIQGNDLGEREKDVGFLIFGRGFELYHYSHYLEVRLLVGLRFRIPWSGSGVQSLGATQTSG